ncbi:cobalamin-binding protein [Alishewanella sp. 16-MA]|uniref:Cobalamin-binding protein n=1 Tax=Alishewanella maricola TaxID=2795740 RepID=A0ABS8C3F9_9ALTE|nr:cobalamin-binding protein [Alishewanella maricola]MCB5226877.1 cobalamin-binding protein [Alishewanella maricola]
MRLLHRMSRLWLSGIILTLLALPLAAAPQRVISLAPHITELVYAVGAGEQLIAVSDYSDYPEAALALPRVNSFAALNIEAILALKPDLVLAWRSGNPAQDLERLQQFGIQVAYSDPVTLDDIALELKQLGALLGHAQLGQQQAAAFQQRLTTLRKAYAHKPRPRVFYAMGVAPLTTVANSAWPAQLLRECASDNIFADAKGDYPQPLLEQLLVRQPTVIIQPQQAATAAFWQRYPNLPAVKNQAFVSLNADWVYRAGPRMLDAMQALCEGLEPYRGSVDNI